jgi:hypothetical protein
VLSALSHMQGASVASSDTKFTGPQGDSTPCSQGVRKYCAKIGEDNAASLALFQHRLGFVEVSRSSIFQVGGNSKQLNMSSTANISGLWRHVTHVQACPGGHT